jgi:hypothetical protein
MLLTLAIFLGALGLLYALGPKGAQGDAHRWFTFPLNDTSHKAQVRSAWRLGHLTPQDDRVELTLEGRCVTAHLYAYLSTGWDHGPVNAASLILGVPLHPAIGPGATIVREDASSAVVVSRAAQRGVLVRQAGPRDYNALVVDWQARRGCSASVMRGSSRELGLLFETFRIV